MRMLLLHSEFLEYKPTKKALKYVKDVDKEKKRLENVLIVFTCAESRDKSKLKKVIEKSVKEIKKQFNEVKAKNVVIYPYAHLSSDLASPYLADKALKKMENESKKQKLPVHVSPFGWYKEFSLHCLGHPLAESFKEIVIGKKEEKEKPISKALEAEEKMKSHWYILTTKGELIPLEVKKGDIVTSKDFDWKKYENLKKFALYEMAKSRKVKKQPPHVEIMRKLELADYESASDPGNLRYYPKGELMRDLIQRWVNENVIDYGAMKVETPIMYSLDHPVMVKYLNRFPARQYIVESIKRKFFLRFSACFGQFIMASDAVISYKELPIRLYEIAKYSHRLEKRGELVGLRRLRSFIMPDCHAFCADVPGAMKEMKKRFDLALEIQEGLGFDIPEDFELGIRVVKEFWEENKEFVIDMVKTYGRPALIEMWDKRFFYFILKYELNFVDNLNKASALTTDQIDVENAENYGIYYIDPGGKKQPVIILHQSPSGAIERVMYGLLEKAAKDQKEGKNPILPLWLSPIQARIIPVSEKYVKQAIELMEKMEKENIRVDLDDRNKSVQKKVRDSEMEWIPFTIVVGEKEIKSDSLPIRIRESGKVEKMKLNDFIKIIKKEVKNRPFRKSSLPKLLSKRPQFVAWS
jgi:threonyl-tRNA synthetase